LKVWALIIYLLFLGGAGCDSPQSLDFDRAMKYQSKNEFREAAAEFEKVMKRNPRSALALKAARESVRIYLYELKSYEKTIAVLKLLVLYSDIPDERWKSQNQIAQIYFDNLARYDKALIEYSRLLASNLSQAEKLKVRLAIARSYYYLGQLSQSLSESREMLLDQTVSDDLVFDVKLLQANISLAQKNFMEAAKNLKTIIAHFPERAKKENVGLNLALCYEELGLHDESIKVLEYVKTYYEPKEYIELRIKKIHQKDLNLPKKRLKK
jgi:tetratricopeptide (TPR) repeat protein